MEIGAGWKRLGPRNEKGEALLLKTGSNKTTLPSISIKTVEWPIQVRCNPESEGIEKEFFERVAI